MAGRKLKLIEKVIIAATLFSGVMIFAFWLMDKKPDRNFYVPDDFAGWIRIQYEVAGAKVLPREEGNIQIVVPASGVVQTSEKMEVGWRRDVFFAGNPEQASELPSMHETDGKIMLYRHAQEFYPRSHLELVRRLPAGTDTTLSDETRITRSASGEVSYEHGRKTLEYIYFTAKAQPIDIKIPAFPPGEALESTEDRSLRTNDL
ncbi:MAG: hypothetical protein AAF206_24170 [Bacteroidota bacterium]